MLMTKLAATAIGCAMIGVLGSWPVAEIAAGVMATVLVLAQLRREVRELQTGAD